MTLEEIVQHNENAWNREVDMKNPSTIPLGLEYMHKVKNGQWLLRVTPNKTIPRQWFPTDLTGLNILCLAAGGGQHAPILAALGASVTLLDISQSQLDQDAQLCKDLSLPIKIIKSSMLKLDMFESNAFDIILNPISNQFIPDLTSFWRGCYRVLKKGGLLISAFMEPINYCFNHSDSVSDREKIRYSLPYSDLLSITKQERATFYDVKDPLEFGHKLEDQIGGQIAAGACIKGFYSDSEESDYFSKYFPTYHVTLAQK